MTSSIDFPSPFRRRWLVLLTAVTISTAGAETYTGSPTIIDGMTVKIDGITHVLEGIEAPGRYDTCAIGGEQWNCGKEAMHGIRSIVKSRQVRCESMRHDRFGNRASVCFVGQRELNAEVVAGGLALAKTPDYKDYESHARARKMGLWKYRGVPKWQVAGKPPRPNCDVKGLINAKGEKSYTVVGDTQYKDYSVREAKGERWFCSSEEAEKAGWRRAWRIEE